MDLAVKTSHVVKYLHDESFVFKIVVGGAGGVGKTTLLHRYLQGSFLPDSTMTVGVAFHSKEIVYEGLKKKVKLSLWDLGGQERFRFLHKSYLNGAMAGVVFFDMSRMDTMMQVNEWVNMFRKNAFPEIPILLGGTKIDTLVDDEQINSVNGYAKDLAVQMGLLAYMPTSSKTGVGVNEMFSCLIDFLLIKSQKIKDVG